MRTGKVLEVRGRGNCSKRSRTNWDKFYSRDCTDGSMSGRISSILANASSNVIYNQLSIKKNKLLDHFPTEDQGSRVHCPSLRPNL
jgi:hypothetical protein